MSDLVVGSKMPQFASDASKLPADNTKTGYGQNGYMGASSDTDLSNPTRSAMAVDLFPFDVKGAFEKAGLDQRAAPNKGDPVAPKDFKQPSFNAPQTRTVSAVSPPLSYGMDQRSSRKS
jgi:hypothetical protein